MALSALLLLTLAHYLFANLVLAQTGGCAAGSNYVHTEQIFANGPLNSNVCNIDPSQANFGFTFGYISDECIDGGVQQDFIATYTGRDGVATTATGIPTSLAEQTSATFFAQYTSFPYSSILDGSPVSFTKTVHGYSNIAAAAAITMHFSPTIFFTDTTSTISTTVPSTTTTTSTLTNQAVAEASTVTLSVTTPAGEATVTASPSTQTVTNTITKLQKTKTVHQINIITTRASCLPPSPSRVSEKTKPRKGSIHRQRIERIAKRQSAPNQPSNYQLPFCGSPLQLTTYTTLTGVSITTVTSGESTVTAYGLTTTTSTYTPTNMVYFSTPSDTITVTPTITATQNIILASSGTTTITHTKTVTQTRYPKHATACRSS